MKCIWRGPLQAARMFWDLKGDALVSMNQEDYEAYWASRPAAGMATQDRALARELGDQDFLRLMDVLMAKARGHCVPPWSVPRAVWRSLLSACGNKEASKPVEEAVRSLCGLCRTAERAPLQWCTSWVAAIDKKNGKPGCNGWRRVEVFDPLSQCWSAQLWKTKT